MVCQYCGTDTPAPASACQTCRTPFPLSYTPDPDSATVGMGTGTGMPRVRANTADALTPGAPFGTRYRIPRPLGAGGMGVVYQAWDAELGVAVALKIIRPDVQADEQTTIEIERRFKRELLLARQVTHKHVVRIHDLGEVDGIKYITMPYIEGRDLADVLHERGRLPVPEVLRLAKQIAAGLVAAHEAGVVHRDLKPENIMIDADGLPLIMDFGISRSVTASTATATAAGAIVGTLEYMAPEQARGMVVDQRADVYALGLIMHDMLAGRRRVAGSESALSEMMKRMQTQPPPLRSIAPEVPEAFERIVTKSLQPDPDQRYASSAALLADLAALDPDGAIARRPISRDYQWKIATATMVVLVLVSAGIAVWLARNRGTAAPKVEAAPETVSVLVVDFQNGTGDPVFEGSLEQALAIAMEGSSFISVYPQKSARTLAAELAPASNGKLSQETAQLIARREGVKVLLAGAIAPKGPGFNLSVRVIDPANGAEVTRAQRDVGTKADVLGGIAALSEQVRRQLDTSKSEMSNVAAAETFTAGSLEAMRAYARGQQMSQAGNYQGALQSLEEAVRYDPRLGRAYSAMGAIYVNLKQTKRAEEAFRKAMDNVDRMSDREKYRTFATYYLGVAGNYEKAIENYEQLIKSFPADNVAYGNLALAYVRVGNVARAKEVAKRGLDIYPRNLLQRTNFAAYSVYAGDFDTAVTEAERVLGENPKYEFAYLPLALAKAGQGDLAGARAAYTRLADVSDTGKSLAALGIADLDLQTGHTSDAATRLRAALALDEKLGSSGELAAKHLALAEAAQSAGQSAPAVAEAKKAIGATRLVNVIVPAARVLIAEGSAPAARDVIKDLTNRLQTQTSAYAEVLEAELAMKEQNYSRAIELLKSAIKRQDLWLARFVLGQAYLAAGPEHAAEALDEFNKCYARRGEVMDVFFADSPTTRYLPPLYYWLGRAYQDKTSTAKWFNEYLKVRAEAPQDALGVDIRRRLAESGNR